MSKSHRRSDVSGRESERGAEQQASGAQDSAQDLYGNARLQSMMGGSVTRPGDASELEADRAASAVVAGESPEVEGTGGFALAGSWLGDMVDDALDSRDDEERLDAEEDLAAFMAETYNEENFHPDTHPDLDPGQRRGNFDAEYDPTSGRLNIIVRIAFDFQNGDPADPDWVTAHPGETFPADQYEWQSDEEEAYKSNVFALVEGAWGNRFSFHNTRQHWESLPTVNVAVDIQDGDTSNAHYVIDVKKWPEQGMGAFVRTMDDSDTQSTGVFNESVAGEGSIEDPDVSDFTRNTSTRAAYAQADVDNPTPIEFGPNSAEVSSGDATLLKTFGETMGGEAMPEFEVTITGHSDNQGEEEANQLLSEDRARNVNNEIATGGPKKQPRVLGVGEAGATEAAEWRRVDIEVGEFTAQQTTVLHEFGHIFGLGDEYPSADGSASRTVGQEAAHSQLAEDQIPGQEPVVAYHSDSIMSNGERMEPYHYVTFLEVLGKMTDTEGEWEIGPAQMGDFPTPSGGDTMMA